MGQSKSRYIELAEPPVPTVPEKERVSVHKKESVYKVNVNAKSSNVNAALMQIVSSTDHEDKYLYRARHPRSHFIIEYKLIDNTVNLTSTKLNILNQVYLELELSDEYTQDPFDALLGVELIVNGYEIENYSGDSLRIYSLYDNGIPPLKFGGKFVIPLKTCLSGKFPCTDDVQLRFKFNNGMIKSKKVYSECKVLTKSEQEERNMQVTTIWCKKEKRYNVNTMENDTVTQFEIVLSGVGDHMCHPVREFVVIVKSKNKVDTPIKQILLCINGQESIYPNIFTQGVYPINKFLINTKNLNAQTYFIPCDPSPLADYPEGSLNFSRIDTSSLKLDLEPDNEYEIVLFYRVFNIIRQGHKLFVA